MTALALPPKLGNVTAEELCAIITATRCCLSRETQAQADIYEALQRRLPGTSPGIVRELRLGPGDIVDIWANGVVIEVKLRGRKLEIWRQLERYASYQPVEAIILASNMSMGLPKTCGGKPAYFVSLGRAWL